SSSAFAGIPASGGTCHPAPRRPRARRDRCPNGLASSSIAVRRGRCPRARVDNDRGERAFALAQPLGCVLELPRLPLQQAIHDFWMGGQESLELTAWQDEAAKRRRGDDIGDRHLAEQTGDLPEIIAGLQRAAVDTVHPDGGSAFEIDVEARAADALAQDPLSVAKEGLLEALRHLLELRTDQVREEREGRNGVDVVVTNRHQAGSLAGGRTLPGWVRRSAAAADCGLRMPMAFTIAPASSSAAPTSMARWNASVEALRTIVASA